MNNLIAQNESLTMLSTQLLSIVNVEREKMGEQPVRLNQFNNRIIDELEGDHYKSFVVENLNKTTSIVYELTIDQCMLVSMRESKSVRKSVLKLLNKAIKPSFKIPQTLGEALQLAADQAKQLELQAPKVEYFDKVLDTTNGFTTTEIASELNLSAIKLNRTLKDMNIQRKIGKRWTLTVNAMGNGYTTERSYIDGTGESRHSMLWTEKGRMFILELFKG